MDLNEIIVFVKVAQAGSFSQAAKELGMPNSTVSAKVSSLEKRLGATLLYRTTRKLSLTQIGKAFYEKSAKNIEGLLAAQEEVTSHQGEPQGLLRVTAPSLFSSSILPDVIAAYIEKYPKVKFELLATDQTVDLIAENVDIAIRAGKLDDSTLISKKLGESYFAPFASPSYIKRSGNISHPKELLNHPCIQFTQVGKDYWSFTNKNKAKLDIAMTGKIVLNELFTVKELAINGKGIALLPTFICADEMKKKQLVRILPDWRSDVRNISFVYPAHKFVSPKLSAFINLASDMIKERLKKFEF